MKFINIVGQSNLKYNDLKPENLIYHESIRFGCSWVVRFQEVNKNLGINGDYYASINAGTYGERGYVNGTEKEYITRAPNTEEIEKFRKRFPGVEFTIPNQELNYEIY